MLRNFLVRLGIILFCIAFIIQITAFLVFPGAVIEVAERIEGQERTIRVLLALLAVLADLTLLQVIIREIRFRRDHGDGLIARSREANVQVSLESVRENVNAAVSRLADLYTVETQVAPERGRVAITLNITAAENLNVRKKTTEIHREIVKVVERQMGLRQAGRPIINFNLARQKPVPLPVPEPAPVVEARPRTGIFGRKTETPTPPKPQPVYTPPPPPPPASSYTPTPPPPARMPTPPPARVPTPEPPRIEPLEPLAPAETHTITTDEAEVFEVKTARDEADNTL